jgi:hypothetical protein
MSSSEPEKTPDLPLSPVARKQSDSYALPVMPSPTKDCGSKRPSVDNEPLSHDWKMLRTTPPTKVTDDPFIDDRKPSGTLLVRIGDTKTHNKMLIPVTTKMIHSAVSESNHFFERWTSSSSCQSCWCSFAFSLPHCHHKNTFAVATLPSMTSH